MATPVPIIEAADTVGPGTIGFAFDGGRVSWPYYVDPENLDKALTAILGSVARTDDGRGRLKRGLPLSHPRFPWLRAERITQGQGIGGGEIVRAATGFPVPEGQLEELGDYKRWLLSVDFTPRMYTLYPDDKVSSFDQVWVDEGNVEVTNKITTEWQRFNDFENVNDPELITADQGMAYLLRDDVHKLVPGPGDPHGDPPHGFSFGAKPRIWIPGSNLRITWSQVPYSYVTSPNSFLVKYAWRVNQFSAFNRGPGEILYMGFTARRYPPLFPSTIPNPDATIFDGEEKVCDVMISCRVTQRRSPAAPSSVGNKIYAGHNLQPWFGQQDGSRRGFYAAVFVDGKDDVTKNDTTKYRPLYPSFPLHLLWTDPDA